jgi:hypothetical protein
MRTIFIIDASILLAAKSRSLEGSKFSKECVEVLFCHAHRYHVSTTTIAGAGARKAWEANRCPQFLNIGTTCAGLPPPKSTQSSLKPSQDDMPSLLYPHRMPKSSLSSRSSSTALTTASGTRSLASLISLTTSTMAPLATWPLVACTSYENTQLP